MPVSAPGGVGRLLVSRMVSEPGDAVISTGDQSPPAFKRVQVTPSVTAPQLYPHIGTGCPSGSEVPEADAVRFTDCANATPLATASAAASADWVNVLNCICDPLVLLRFVDHVIPRVDQHHHQHA